MSSLDTPDGHSKNEAKNGTENGAKNTDSGTTLNTSSDLNSSDLMPSDLMPSDLTPSDLMVEAIDFTPIGAPTTKAKGRFPLLALAISALLLLSGLILWFLMTSRAVSINTEPSHAEIEISGGASFALADHYLLRPGQYQLQVSAPGFANHNDDLKVTDEESQSQSITLAKLPGHLDISTTPEKASVLLDGKNKGLTPLILAELAPGTYHLKIAAPRYFAIEQDVEIAGLDQTTQLSFKLKPAWGDITFRSQPPGATISVAGKDYGPSPTTVPVLASGEQVSLALAGYKTWQQTTSVAVGEHKEWPLITLSPADAQVQLASVPNGARITVNGQYLGETPTTLALSPDTPHQVSLFLLGYQHASQQIKLKPSQQQVLSVKLKAKLGSLNISSKPSHARLYIDGKLRGTTPLTLALPAHPWRLEVRKSGYRAMTKSSVPKPGVQQALHFALSTILQTANSPLPATITSAAGQTMKLLKPNSSFTMGASRREQGRRANEILRTVRLSKSFYLATTEVNNQQFRKFNKEHSSSHVDSHSLNYLTQPVVNIDWASAARYCNWLSQKENLEPFYIEKDGSISGINPEALGYRLPTEAEWAWAARYQSDGSMRKFPWGSTFPPTKSRHNIADRSAANIVPRTINSYNDAQAVSAPVASYPANARGIYDLGGNVAEWLHDYYSIALINSGSASSDSINSDPINTDPLGPEQGEYRVIRGPSWRHGGISELRLSFRDYGDKARDDLGFRIARYAQSP